MRKLKYTFTILLIIAITIGVVLAPRLINEQKQDQILNETVYSNYYSGNRPKLTSEQVVNLYYNHEINLIYNSGPTSIKNTNAIQNNITEVTKLLFSGNETIHKSIIAVLSGNDITYTRNNILIKINGQPTALNFVNCAVYEENGFFDIFYEEKTKTVIRFSCQLFGKSFSSIEEADSYIEKITSMLYGYYEKQLNLNDEYFFVINYPVEIKQEENLYLANICINCELKQKGNENEYEGDLEIYN